MTPLELQNKHCPICGEPMIFVDHWEANGTDEPSHEPYWDLTCDCNPAEVEKAEWKEKV